MKIEEKKFDFVKEGESSAMSRLSPKQRKFIKTFLETGNKSKAAREAGYNCTKKAGQDIIRQKGMQEAIKELLEANGLDDKSLISMHRELLNATTMKELAKEVVEVPDNQIRFQALKLAYQLKGHFVHVLVADRKEDPMKSADVVLLDESGKALVGGNTAPTNRPN